MDYHRPTDTVEARLRSCRTPPELLARPRAPEPQPRQYSKPPRRWWTGQHDSNATVTALALFASLPAGNITSRATWVSRSPRETGRRRTHLRQPADLSASEFGTQVHALLAGKPVPDPEPEALRLAEVFRQSPLGRRAARAARSEREFDFLMAVEDLVVRGQVDLWFEEGGELVVVDYKTDDVNAAEAHQRARDYALQLRLYALAVEPWPAAPPTAPASTSCGPTPWWRSTCPPPYGKSRTDRSGLSASTI